MRGVYKAFRKFWRHGEISLRARNLKKHLMNHRHPYPYPPGGYYRTPPLPPPSYLQSLSRAQPATKNGIILMHYTPDQNSLIEGVKINISMAQNARLELNINCNSGNIVKTERMDSSLLPPPPPPPPPPATPAMPGSTVRNDRLYENGKLVPYIPGVYACGHPITALRPVAPVAPIRRYSLRHSS